jgi:hypothetical protein
MKQGWNGSNNHDRFCHLRIYCFWHGYGNCGNTFILDKKMTAFEMADALNQYGKTTTLANINISEVVTMLRMQAHEVNALIEQNNELREQLDAVR